MRRNVHKLVFRILCHSKSTCGSYAPMVSVPAVRLTPIITRIPTGMRFHDEHRACQVIRGYRRIHVFRARLPPTIFQQSLIGIET